MRQANLQAGLFGGGLAVILGIIALLPYIGPCIALPTYPIVFFLTGLVAVRIVDFQPGVTEASAGGAVAGLLAATLGGLAAMFLAPLRLQLAGGPEDLVAALPPEVVESLLTAGLDPLAVMDLIGGVGVGILCCLGQLTTGVLLAAAGAGLYAAYRRT
jgi:hypothetical protein